jgi:uncharacterized Ntn-hydrolase superfamily protein
MIVRKRDAGYGGNNDILVDLRVDDHPDPVIELARLYEIHDLLFGRTPEDQLIPLEQVQAELGSRLGSLGFDGELERRWPHGRAAEPGKAGAGHHRPGRPADPTNARPRRARRRPGAG